MEPVRKSQRTSSITARSSRFKNSGQTTESKRKHWVQLQAPQGSFPIGLPCLTKNKRPYQYGHLKGDIYTLYVHFSTVDEASKYAEKWSTTFGACLVEDQHTGNLSWRSGIPPEPRDFPYKLFTATITSKNGYACPNPQVLPPILRGLDFPFFIMRNTKEICVLFETDEKVDLYSDTIYSIQSEIEAGGNVTCTVKELSIEQQPSLRVVLFLEEQKGTSYNLPNSEMQDNAYATLLRLIEEVTLVLDIPSN